MWNRVADLEELAGLDSGAWEQFARAVEDCAVTGRWPGLYLGEDDHLEARWIINSVAISSQPLQAPARQPGGPGGRTIMPDPYDLFHTGGTRVDALVTEPSLSQLMADVTPAPRRMGRSRRAGLTAAANYRPRSRPAFR